MAYGDAGQSLSDKKYQYFGSQRSYYTGSTIGSTIKQVWFDFSGTNTGFGTANNLLSQRIILAASGGNTAPIEWSFVSGISGTVFAGAAWPGEVFTMDGVNQSGIWVRTSAADQVFRVWAW